jgi:hypothetical protein
MDISKTRIRAHLGQNRAWRNAPKCKPYLRPPPLQGEFPRVTIRK